MTYFIFTLDVLRFFNNDEKSLVHMYYAVMRPKRQNSILHAASPVSQNLSVEILNKFYIF